MNIWTLVKQNKKSIGILLSALISCSVSAKEVLKINTLDWPPYTSESLPQKGFVTEIVTTALQKAGYESKVTFTVWQRAIDEVVKSDEAIAYFPGYLEDCANNKTYASKPIGSGPLNFAQNVKTPVSWTQLSDLKSKSIGTVIGYVNTPEFDAMVSKRELNATPVKDDQTNLLKLQDGRLDLAVIDGNVFKYLLTQNKGLKNLELNPIKLADTPLYVCFKDTPKGKLLVQAFDDVIKTLDVQKMAQDYLDKLNK